MVLPSFISLSTVLIVAPLEAVFSVAWTAAGTSLKDIFTSFSSFSLWCIMLQPATARESEASPARNQCLVMKAPSPVNMRWTERLGLDGAEHIGAFMKGK